MKLLLLWEIVIVMINWYQVIVSSSSVSKHTPLVINKSDSGFAVGDFVNHSYNYDRIGLRSVLKKSL